MPKNILFLNLNCFSALGGIEKLCRIVSKALYDISLVCPASIDVHSLHDKVEAAKGNKYIPAEFFRCYGGKRVRFIYHSVKKGIKADRVILSHINLLPVGWLIKRLSPKTEVILFAHGIEIWQIPLGFKKFMLTVCDRFLCVSDFTRQQLISLHRVPKAKCEVLNNCLDPFFPQGECLSHFQDIRSELGITADIPVIFTLARMQAAERYKGYDKVLYALPHLKKRYPGIKYVIGGKADENEAAYLKQLINELRLSEDVRMVGFIPDEQLPSYFQMANIFAMPSSNEGFGITFIESLYFGVPVLAGNSDGSRDIMISPGFGKMADPLNKEVIAQVLESLLGAISDFHPDRNILMNTFGYDNYVEKLKSLLAA